MLFLKKNNIFVKKVMVEIDFSTEEGKQEFKKYVFDVVQKDDKSELCELLNSMFSLVIEHEIKFNNIKNNI
jgi:hypothetical protein